MIPPFTGNGMAMAFQSAAIALEPLVAWSAGRSSWQEAASAIEAGLASSFGRRLTAADILHRVLLDRRGRHVARWLSRTRLLPFRPLLALVR
jgi:menaquinone-9 beta-reductase